MKPTVSTMEMAQSLFLLYHPRSLIATGRFRNASVATDSTHRQKSTRDLIVPRRSFRNPLIEFNKNSNGWQTAVTHAISRPNALRVQTLRASKKENLATAADAEAPATTPEAHVGTVLGISIPTSLANVNPGRKLASPPVRPRRISHRARWSPPM